MSSMYLSEKMAFSCCLRGTAAFSSSCVSRVTRSLVK